MKNEITVKDLKIFVEVFRSRSVTVASKTLDIPQPSVSRIIADIEEHYNVRLFERIQKKIIPTPEGEKFYQYALHLTEYYNRMEKSLISSERYENMRIGASIKLGNELMPKLIKEFSKMHTEVRCYVKITNQVTLEKKLISNELDLAFCENILDPDQFISSKFGEDKLVVVLPKGHELLKKQSITLEDILDYPLLVREEGSGSRELLKNVLRAHGLTAKPSWESISTDAILKAVYRNIGISVLPASLVSKHIQKGELFTVPIEGNPFIHNLYIVSHKEKYLSGNMKDLIGLAREIYENEKSKEGFI